MVRHHYPELFKDDDATTQQRVADVAARCYEFSEYLVDVLGIDRVQASFPARVTYHDSCHLLRGLGIKEQPRRLLASVEGLTLNELPGAEECCGFGGTFSIKHPEISAAMAEDKVHNILASGADTVVGCDMGCLMNIQGLISRKGADIKVMHIAQLLAKGIA